MPSMPRFVANPLLTFLDYVDQSGRLLQLSIEGISMLMASPTIVEVLKQTDIKTYSPAEAMRRDEEFRRSLDTANARADFARKEREAGFPLLHAHALVGAWGAWEAAIEDTLIAILLKEEDLLRGEAFSKVRIPLAEFELLDKEGIRRLIEELNRGQGIGRGQGVEGSETLLNLVGLSGAVDSQIRKTIWEMHHIRNVIVHRRSVADRRLVQACPWLNLQVGDQVVVSHDAFGSYYGALHEYLMIIVRRLGVKYDVNIDALIEAHAAKRIVIEGDSGAGTPDFED